MRVAVVGCGAAAAYYHLPAIARTLVREQLWLVDPDRERAASLARRYGREDQVAEDYGELLGSIDAAIVAVPNDLHAPVAADLLAHGIHVLCEKPLARTAEEAQAIVETARPGTVLAVGHFRRFFASTRLLGDLLEHGLCGRPLSFTAEEGFVYAWGSASAFWLDRARAGGGVLIDLGSHVLDQLLVWFGESLGVRGYEDNAYGGVESDCRLALALADGVTGTVELSRTRELRNSIRIECEGGTVEAPLPHAGSIVASFPDGASYALEVERDKVGRDHGYSAAFEAQLRDFLHAIEHGGRPAATGSDALRVLTLVGECYARRQPLDEPWVFETLSRPAPAAVGS